MRLALGTRKGLWVATLDGRKWRLSQPLLETAEFASVAWVPRPGQAGHRLLVGAKSWFWGPTVVASDDGGRTWTETGEAPIAFSAEDGAVVERIWTLEPDPLLDDVVWAGAEPHSLWRSTDGGASFALVDGLWSHPHRPHWMAGAGGPALHNIHRRSDGSTFVAMTGAGVYRSPDGFTNWQPANRGITADFMPDPHPEYGQCVHRLAIDGVDDRRLYVQNHGGVFRSDDSGDSWTDVSQGLPESEFGFAILAHPTSASTLWVIPIQAETMLPAEGKLRVWRSDDAGESWAAQGHGLPDDFYAAVLRDAAHVVSHSGDAALAFGTRNGHVYASLDGGVTFEEVARDLPDVLSVRILAD